MNFKYYRECPCCGAKQEIDPNTLGIMEPKTINPNELPQAPAVKKPPTEISIINEHGGGVSAGIR